MLTFEPFREWCVKQKKKRTDLIRECGFSPTTVAKIFGDKFPIRSDVLETLCRVYRRKIHQIIEYREDLHV